MIVKSMEHLGNGIYHVTVDNLEPCTAYVASIRFDDGMVLIDRYSEKEDAIKKIKQQPFF